MIGVGLSCKDPHIVDQIADFLTKAGKRIDIKLSSMLDVSISGDLLTLGIYHESGTNYYKSYINMEKSTNIQLIELLSILRNIDREMVIDGLLCKKLIIRAISDKIMDRNLDEHEKELLFKDYIKAEYNHKSGIINSD